MLHELLTLPITWSVLSAQGHAFLLEASCLLILVVALAAQALCCLHLSKISRSGSAASESRIHWH